MDLRKEQLIDWLNTVLDGRIESVVSASSDASFRRYFRVFADGQKFIAMDAPPEKEDCQPFVHVAHLLEGAGVNVPTIFQYAETEGFMLLTDFGSDCLLDHLNDQNVDEFYALATEQLHLMHKMTEVDSKLDAYNTTRLSDEMGLFFQWFLTALLGVELTAQQQNELAQSQQWLIEQALAQPQVFVHRDYHSRNLMVDGARLGVIDFQDALIGPITYDLVSLYRDCYINWDDEKVYRWLDVFLAERKQNGFSQSFSNEQFYQWFDAMGVQRHLKAIGIFSRLLLRDGKKGYLKDIPRTLGYVHAVSKRYEALKPIQRLLEEHAVQTVLQARLLDEGVL